MSSTEGKAHLHGWRMDSFQLHVAVGYWASVVGPGYCTAAGGMWGFARAAELLAPIRHVTQSLKIYIKC
jgi:hypothetical protein